MGVVSRGLLKIAATDAGWELGREVCKELSVLLNMRYDKLKQKQIEHERHQSEDLSFGEKDEIEYILRIWEANRRDQDEILDLINKGDIKGTPSQYGITEEPNDFKLLAGPRSMFSNSEDKYTLHQSVRGKDVFVLDTSYTPPEVPYDIVRSIIDKVKIRKDTPNLEKLVAKFVVDAREHIPTVADNTMRALILLSSIEESKAKNTNHICALSGYGRQDHQTARESITSVLTAKLKIATGIKSYSTFEFHAPQEKGFYRDIDSDNLLTTRLLLDRIYEDHKDISDFVAMRRDKKPSDMPDAKEMTIYNQFVYVSPDAGGVERAKEYAKKSKGISIAIASKERDYKAVNKVDSVKIIGDVAGKKVFIFDDMIDTAGTICEVIEALKKNGVEEVYIATTHPLMSGPAIDRLDVLHKKGKGILKKVYACNTVTRNKEFEKLHGWYESVSVAKLAARTIYNTNLDRPVEDVYRAM